MERCSISLYYVTKHYLSYRLGLGILTPDFYFSSSNLVCIGTGVSKLDTPPRPLERSWCPFPRLSRHGRASGAKASLRRTGRPATVSMNTRVASISGGPGPGDGPSLPLPCHHRILGTQARTRRDEAWSCAVRRCWKKKTLGMHVFLAELRALSCVLYVVEY